MFNHTLLRGRSGGGEDIHGDGIFIMGVGRPNFGRGGQFFCEGEGSNFFAKKGGKGVGKKIFAKNFLSLPVFLQS